jgi:hypothetical protein
MNTRYLMIASALVMAVIGLSLTFAPQEIMRMLGGEAAGWPLIVLQLCGALYCGFALLNWNAKVVILGGIYGQPIVVGNLVHFTMGALALMKLLIAHSSEPALWSLAIIYALFAALFGYVMYTHPTK